MTDMHGINNYWQQLTNEKIQPGKHFDSVGGAGRFCD